MPGYFDSRPNGGRISSVLPRCYRSDFGVAAYANNHDEMDVTCISECEFS